MGCGGVAGERAGYQVHQTGFADSWSAGLERGAFCAADEKFNFEKIAKRRTLDIAAVNTAMRIRTTEGVIVDARISAGGVAPVPLFLERSSAWLAGKPVSAETAM